MAQTIAAPVLPNGAALPGDIGLQAWTFDPAICPGSATLAAAAYSASQIRLEEAILANGLSIGVATGGTVLAGCGIALYTAYYNADAGGLAVAAPRLIAQGLISGSADISAALQTSGLFLQAAFAVSQELLAGIYSVVSWVTSATTTPLLSRGHTGAVGLGNTAPGTAFACRFGRDTADVPASAVAPAALPGLLAATPIASLWAGIF